MKDSINTPINYYDSEKRLIVGHNLVGKIHPQLMSKLIRRSNDGSTRCQQARITDYLEGLLTNG
ncbi:hypothetical protein M2E35_01820 [Klebsiella pneumoniae]|uniref:hypothetical protein n=1 Tax=Enterobacter cloacae TaxID=550 RepID=UPI000949857E|nr:hypothetical protein [Enterobacter cloacae]MDZ3376434.1 hypothetical protein [Klebsiella pneumoniae]MDZ3496651.1 hypothetical protein [Klebsiella pneumoniae]MDZ3556331.1 hypothetical protein [Klebsiella pneumoniae]MDZ3561989.1 hypothetical protein [Klebsiella pneumoniae]MDZ3578918.1 hypothetical protein [Klebsiella pneumoniae]